MTAVTVQCNVYVNTLILCEGNVEVIKKSVLLFQKVKCVLNSNETSDDKIHEMCNKVWLLQDLPVSGHVISPNF